MDLSLEREVCYLLSVRNVSAQDFPSGPLAKTLCSQCRGPGFDPWSEKWSEVPQSCPTLCFSMDCTGHGILHVRILEWVAFPFSWGVFPTQRLNPGLPHCRQILYQLCYKGSPRILESVAYPFSRGSSRTRNMNRGLLRCRRILYQLSCQDETGAYYTEWSKPERKTPIQYTNSYIWNLER